MDKPHFVTWRHDSGLFLSDHVHDCDAGNRGTGGLIVLETEHGFDDAFDQTMVLLDNVIEILDHAMLNRDSEISKIDLFGNRHFGAAV